MASQKQSQAASGPAKSGSAATRSGSGNSGRGGQQAKSGAGQGRAGGGAGGRPQNSRAQNGRGQGGQGQGGRGQGGRTGPARPAGAQARGGVQVAESPTAKAAQQYGTPRWIQLTALVLSLAGLGVSIYLTIVHFVSKNILICSANGTINCEKVLSSSQAMVFGVFPVAVLGLAFYLFMVAINSPWAWRSPLDVIWWARLAGAVTGMGFVLYLIYAELIQIGNICLWCTSVHVITFLLFVLMVFTATLGRAPAAKAATR